MRDTRKPLGRKSYGHIPHLPGSRMGPSDKQCHEGQARICTEQARDRHDHVYVTEKLDGSNCTIARLEDGRIVALGRAGYHAMTSRYEQHRMFYRWVMQRQERWTAALDPGERLVGEWLAQAHGTRYELRGEPFVPFDLMVGARRLPKRCLDAAVAACGLETPAEIASGPCSIERAMKTLWPYGFHGAQDEVEGAVWRVERDELVSKGHGPERHRVVDFLAKYVRPDKVDGGYLPEVSGRDAVWNWMP